MDSTTIEAMHEQVRVIYRAVTGTELSLSIDTGSTADPNTIDTQVPLSENEVERRFVQLDMLARTIPELTQRIPPFSFTPLADILESQGELRIEVAVPGIERGDVEVMLNREDELIVTGVRRGICASNGRSFVYAEIPRGPFKRTIHLPCHAQPPSRVDVENGIIAIQLFKA